MKGNVSWCNGTTYATRLPAVYITLNATLATRGAVAQKRFAKLGCMPDQLVAYRHPLGSIVGIFRSHVLALRYLASLAPASLYMVFAR